MSAIFNDSNQGDWPAYPQDAEQGNCEFWRHGMTMRDAFAIAALPMLMQFEREIPDKARGGKLPSECVASNAYQVADAMLAERAK